MKNLMISLVLTMCLFSVPGCGGKNHIELEQKIKFMTDAELINHYEMIVARMTDIDFKKEQSLEQNREIIDTDQSHISHLHVHDNWSTLKKEKEITLSEMKKRGISPP